MDESLRKELRTRDRERYLSVLWAPKKARAALVALHALDLELLRVVATAREPMLAEIRLAWWREQLEGMGEGKTPPPQPILAELDKEARPLGIDFARFAAIEEGFRPLLFDDALNIPAVAKARGAPLFAAMLEILAPAPGDAVRAAAALAGERWALAQLWRGGFGQAEHLLERAIPPGFPEAPPVRLPPALRALDALAADDWSRMGHDKPLSREAAPRRQWIMLRAAL